MLSYVAPRHRGSTGLSTARRCSVVGQPARQPLAAHWHRKISRKYVIAAYRKCWRDGRRAVALQTAGTAAPCRALCVYRWRRTRSRCSSAEQRQRGRPRWPTLRRAACRRSGPRRRRAPPAMAARAARRTGGGGAARRKGGVVAFTAEESAAAAAADADADATTAAVASVFLQRDAGNNVLERYLQRLEGSRGDAMASYETVWVCDQLAEDLSARCSALRRAGAPAAEWAATTALLQGVSDAKVAVLDNCYEAVDAMIAQLDRRTRLMEAHVREQARLVDASLDAFAAAAHPHAAAARGEALPRRARVAAGAPAAHPPTAALPGVAAMRELAAVALSGATSRAAAAAAASATGDGTVDPMEPLYCVCRQVAFGDMIACDNPDCAVEWFHCQCVGITRATHPTTWYCKDCAAARAAHAAT